MTPDVAERYIALGFRSLVDFEVNSQGSDVVVAWYSAQPMPNEAEINAVDMTPAAVAARALAKSYTATKALMTADSPSDKRWKVLVIELVAELNLHAAKHNAILNAIDGAATLVAMKAAIAAIPDFPTRTIAQLKTSMGNKIDAGQADG